MLFRSTSYLELLSTFKNLLKFKRDQVQTAKRRLVIGLDKLGTTEVEVDKLKNHLEEMQPVLIKTSKEVEEMMVVIAADKEEAAEVAEQHERSVASALHALAAMLSGVPSGGVAQLTPLLQEHALPALWRLGACGSERRRANE